MRCNGFVGRVYHHEQFLEVFRSDVLVLQYGQITIVLLSNPKVHQRLSSSYKKFQSSSENHLCGVPRQCRVAHAESLTFKHYFFALSRYKWSGIDTAFGVPDIVTLLYQQRNISPPWSDTFRSSSLSYPHWSMRGSMRTRGRGTGRRPRTPVLYVLLINSLGYIFFRTDAIFSCPMLLY